LNTSIVFIFAYFYELYRNRKHIYMHVVYHCNTPHKIHWFWL